MRIIPLIEFYARRHEQIGDLLSRSRGTVPAILELARAIVPIINRRWPHINPDGILDDALRTAEQVFEDPDSKDAREYPDAKQI